MKMISFKFHILIYFLAAKECFLAYENHFGPNYGRQWLLFVDENNITHEMHFSSLPMERRGLTLGKVYCYLYTRNNIDDGELLTLPNDDSEINSNYFNTSNDVKAVTHGWLSSGKAEWIQNIKNELLTAFDLNVLLIDWSEIAKNIVYPWPAFSTRYVGKHLAKIIKSLKRTYKISNNTHLIGHSLGAQVMGYAGMFLQGQLSRITGLDPARPLFEIPMMDQNYRLEKSDAQYVDIIHTCAGLYGYKYSHGHADFYPNSGTAPQPGCEGLQHMSEGCSHGRSHEYFLESIYTQKGFYSFPCENWNNFRNNMCRSNPTLMGVLTSDDTKGNMYLYTENQTEYACGM